MSRTILGVPQLVLVHAVTRCARCVVLQFLVTLLCSAFEGVGVIPVARASFVSLKNIHQAKDLGHHCHRSSQNNKSPATSSPVAVKCLSARMLPQTIENDIDLIFDTVDIEVPMGLILKENDSKSEDSNDDDNNNGVFILQISPQSNAIEFSKRGKLCCGDSVVAINGIDCSAKSFEQIMELMQQQQQQLEVSQLSLTVSRSKDVCKVIFPNGVCVGTLPGTHFCNLALDAQYQTPYNCRNGSCGTCEHQMKMLSRNEDEGNDDIEVLTKHRYVRPCVGVVPKIYDSIYITPSDRYYN